MGRSLGWLAGAAALAAVPSLAGWGGPDGGGGAAPAALPAPVRGAGPLRPAILYPRGRVGSPCPPLVFAVPWTGDALAVELRTAAGFRGRVQTRARSLPWPSSWPLLEPGQPAILTLHVCARRSRAAVVLAEGRPPWHRERSGAQSVELLLRHGRPADAWRLACQDPRIPRAARAEAALRAHVPPSGLRRSHGEEPR